MFVKADRLILLVYAKSLVIVQCVSIYITYLKSCWLYRDVHTLNVVMKRCF